jgi:hypothetical protein
MATLISATSSCASARGQVLDEVDRFGRGILANRKAVTAADSVTRITSAALNSREGEPAQVIANAQLVFAVVLLHSRSPLSHQFHGSLAIAHGSGFIAIGRAQETILEGLESDQFLELDASFDKAGSVKEPVRGPWQRAFKVGFAAKAGGEVAHKCMPGHLSPSPRAIGVMPAAFSFCTSSRNSVQVAGGASMPAWANRSLLYQKPTMPISHGTP